MTREIEVVAIVHVTGTANISGASVEMRVGHVWRPD